MSDQEQKQLTLDAEPLSGADSVPVTLGNAALSDEVYRSSVGLSMSINKDLLLATELPPHITDQTKINELGTMIENFTRLPERLEFKPGITLIVGGNGKGKSTLGRALHLVSSFAEEVQYNVNNRGQTPDAAREAAMYNFKIDYAREDSESVELRAAGIPQELARAFADDVEMTSAIRPEYVDVSSIAGIATQRAREMGESKYRQGTGSMRHADGSTAIVNMMVVDEKQRDQSRGSTRQTVDKEIARIERIQKRADGPVVTFIDEPETGLSPRRHNEIEHELESIFVSAGGAHGANTVIVPTNSVILFNSDLPRIDLDYPERGIHRPSEYTEHSS